MLCIGVNFNIIYKERFVFFSDDVRSHINTVQEDLILLIYNHKYNSIWTTTALIDIKVNESPSREAKWLNETNHTSFKPE